MKARTAYFPITALFYLLLSASCHKTDKPGGGPGDGNINISGRVLDESKRPLSGVEVTSGTTKVTTDVNGKFFITNAEIKSGTAFVKLNKSEYYTGIRTITPTENATNNIEVTLIKKIMVGAFDATSGGQVSVPTGGTIDFSAGAMVNASNNSSYTGGVGVYAHFIDPTSTNFQSVLPGDLRGINASGQQVGLESFGMMAVEMVGESGEKLQLATGKQATITFPIPASLIATAPATIPLWYLDETTGQWKEQGTATKQGTDYVGNVNHFSFWNCDYPFPTINFKAIIQDKQNQILPNVAVHIRRADGSMGFGRTDVNGKVVGLVPANETLKMIVIGKCSSDSFNIGPFSSDQDLGVVHVNVANENVQVVVSGTALTCTGAPITNGFVTVFVDGVYYGKEINNGIFKDTFYRCNTSPVSAQVVAVNIDSNKQSDPITISISSGSVNAGQLNACVPSTSFINYTINGVYYSLNKPADSLYCGMYNYNYNSSSVLIETYTFANPVEHSDLLIYGTTIGTAPVKYISIQLSDGRYFKQRDTASITATITEFGGPGDYIGGSFSGIIRDTVARIDVPITSKFRILRDPY